MGITEETTWGNWIGDISLPTPDSAVPSGTTDGIMSIWGEDRITQLDTLIAGDYTDNSSYSLPPGVVDTNAAFGDISFPEGERQFDASDSGVESGASEVMSIWTADRKTKLRTLATSTFTNNSGYTLPAGIVGSTSYPFDKQPLDNEQMFGSEEPGVKVGYTYLGTRISGSVLLLNDDDGSTYVVEGATVKTKRDGREFRTQPDETDGSFELPIGEGGSYEVTATHPLLKEQTKSFSPEDGESIPGVEFYLTAPSGKSGLSLGGFGVG